LTTATAQIQASLVDVGAPPLGTVVDEAFQLLIDQAVSGGAGTQSFMRHIQSFHALMSYISSQGANAYTMTTAPDGISVSATDGHSIMSVQTVLASSDAPIIPNTQVVGIATISLKSPEPDQLTRFTEAGWEIIDKLDHLHSGAELWEALIKPLGQQAKTLLSNVIDGWLNTGAKAVGDVSGEIEMTTIKAVSEVSSEEVTLEVAEETVTMAVEWGAVVETLGVAAAVAAIPYLVSCISKTFVLNFKIVNLSRRDFTWSLAYLSEGGATAEPKTNTLPAPTVVTNPLTSKRSTVVQEADFTFGNSDGFEGLGFVLAVSQANSSQPLAAVVVNIPWSSANRVAVVSPYGPNGQLLAWQQVFEANSSSNGALNGKWGNAEFGIDVGIDALQGNGDLYNVVARIRDI
jgi:hypothetical protein